ncbi:hypothetical protein GQ42DRAFT_112202, partial [Ramicandelaber brevisporus]
VESYYGFVADTHDAWVLVEAARAGLVGRLQAVPDSAQLRGIRSGSAIVYNRSEVRLPRFNDGLEWTASSIENNMLLYRQ